LLDCSLWRATFDRITRSPRAIRDYEWLPQRHAIMVDGGAGGPVPVPDPGPG
jgi:hypothetical protein